MIAPVAVPVQADTLRILRAIASSTALETGQAVHEIEAWLLADGSKYRELDLAVSTLTR